MMYCCGEQLTALSAQMSTALSQAEWFVKPGFCKDAPRVSRLEDRHSHCGFLPAVIQAESNVKLQPRHFKILCLHWQRSRSLR